MIRPGTRYRLLDADEEIFDITTAAGTWRFPSQLGTRNPQLATNFFV